MLYFTCFFCFGIKVFASCLLRLLTSLSYFCVLQKSRLNNSTFVYFHIDFLSWMYFFCPRPFIVRWDVYFDVSLCCPRFFLSSACMQACSTNWKGASQTSVRIKAIIVLNRIRDYATMSRDAVSQFAMIKTRLRVSTTKACSLLTQTYTIYSLFKKCKLSELKNETPSQTYGASICVSRLFYI